MAARRVVGEDLLGRQDGGGGIDGDVQRRDPRPRRPRRPRERLPGRSGRRAGRPARPGWSSSCLCLRSIKHRIPPAVAGRQHGRRPVSVSPLFRTARPSAGPVPPDDSETGWAMDRNATSSVARSASRSSSSTAKGSPLRYRSSIMILPPYLTPTVKSCSARQSNLASPMISFAPLDRWRGLSGTRAGPSRNRRSGGRQA